MKLDTQIDQIMIIEGRLREALSQCKAARRASFANRHDKIRRVLNDIEHAQAIGKALVNEKQS